MSVAVLTNVVIFFFPLPFFFSCLLVLLVVFCVFVLGFCLCLFVVVVGFVFFFLCKHQCPAVCSGNSLVAGCCVAKPF